MGTGQLKANDLGANVTRSVIAYPQTGLTEAPNWFDHIALLERNARRSLNIRIICLASKYLH
jgi:hypothetical protein